MVPPEYAQEGHQEISESGVRVTVVQGAKSEEELEAQRRQEEQDKLAKEAHDRQLTQDRVLLRTFTSEGELKMARDSKLAVIQSRITLAENRAASLQANLEVLEAQAAQEERSGKGVQEKLARNIQEVKRQLENNRAYVQARRKDQEELQAQFDADLARFRALKSHQVKPGQL
jgi:glutamate 5-kinase